MIADNNGLFVINIDKQVRDPIIPINENANNFFLPNFLIKYIGGNVIKKFTIVIPSVINLDVWVSAIDENIVFEKYKIAFIPLVCCDANKIIAKITYVLWDVSFKMSVIVKWFCSSTSSYSSEFCKRVSFL